MPKTITFVGQKRILQELEYELPGVRAGRNVNYLLKASTGYGKTLLATIMIYEIAPENFWYCLPDNEGQVNIDIRKRIIFIDEVHTLKNPERIYPLMDSKKHVFILATNEAGKLPDALMRRCIPLIFDDYTTREMVVLVKNYFLENGINLPDELARVVAENTNLSPGNAVILCERLILIMQHKGVPKESAELREWISDVLNVKGGLTNEHIKYLELLRDLGRASLDTLVNTLNMDKGTIVHTIEPTLLKKRLIQITSRGRIPR